MVILTPESETIGYPSRSKNPMAELSSPAAMNPRTPVWNASSNNTFPHGLPWVMKIGSAA